MSPAKRAANRPEKRADARRNRERILQAAFTVFARIGVDAQMSDVAEAAGVGVATLYRNFPTKEAMVNAMVLDRLQRCTEVARTVGEDEDPWRALVRYFQFATNLQLENRVLSQFLSGRIGGSPDLLEQRDILYKLVDDIVHRAQASGQLRADVNVTDIRMAGVAFARVSSSELPHVQRLVRRYVNIVMDGFRAPGQEELEGPPLTIAESEDAFLLRGTTEEPEQTRAFRRGRRTWPSGT